MDQIFPSGSAPKVPKSSCSSAVPAYIDICELSPLLSPFPKPSKEQVRQPGAKTTPYPPPHIQCHIHFTKWKESHSLCLARHIQQHSSCSKARQPGPKGEGVREADHLCRKESPLARAYGPSCCAGSQHRHPFGLLSATGYPSRTRYPQPAVRKQLVSAVAVNLCF